MSNLFEIDAQVDALAEKLIDPETGEVDESTLKAIDDLQMEKKQKIEYLALKSKNIRADVDAMKKEKETFDKRIKTSTNHADRIDDYIGSSLRGEAFSTSKVNIKFRKTKSVEIVNAELIPEKFILCRTELKPQKALIKEAIKNGEEVPGAVISENMKMKIE